MASSTRTTHRTWIDSLGRVQYLEDLDPLAARNANIELFARMTLTDTKEWESLHGR